MFCQGNSNNCPAAFISDTVCINYHSKSHSQHQTVLYLLDERKQWLFYTADKYASTMNWNRERLPGVRKRSTVFVAWCTDKPGLTKTKHHIYLHMLNYILLTQYSDKWYVWCNSKDTNIDMAYHVYLVYYTHGY